MLINLDFCFKNSYNYVNIDLFSSKYEKKKKRRIDMP